MAKKKRKKRRAGLRADWIVVGVTALVALAIVLILLKVTQPAQAPEPTPAPVTDAPTRLPTPEPTPTLAPTPTASPTPEPIVGPDVLSFYRPETINYSPRVRIGDTFTAPWKRGEDIGSFEAIPSTAERLEEKIFPTLYDAVWTAFDDTEGCKIGYRLTYTLDDGTEYDMPIRSPKDIDHTEYIEVWLYDDYHQTPYEYYSHLRESWMTDETLITSIKLTAGQQIKHVTDIWLEAYIYRSEADFDAQGRYIGRVSCRTHIRKG